MGYGLSSATLHKSIVLNVGTISDGTNTEKLYRVDSTGATLLKTYSFPENKGCVYTFGQSPDQPKIFLPGLGSGTAYDAAGALYYTVNADTGVMKLPAASATPQDIYDEGCATIRVTDQGKLALTGFDADANQYYLGTIDTAGPKTQTPTKLATVSADGNLFITQYSTSGHTVQYQTLEFPPNSPMPVFSINGIKITATDPSSAQTWSDQIQTGFVMQGNVAGTGVGQFPYWSIRPSGPSCTSSGVIKLVDAGTFSTVMTVDPAADISTDACSRTGTLWGYNTHFLFGSIGNAGNATETWAYGVFGGVGGTLHVLGHYTLASGEDYLYVMPMF